jgi:hypothetical protein
VIADKEYVFPGEIFDVFCAGDLQLIYDHQSGIGNNPHKGIHQLADYTNLFQTLGE